MPVSILTSLLISSALLLPGARDNSSPVLQFSQASCHPEQDIRLLVDRGTIHSRSMDQPDAWAISEADNKEEESSDGDSEEIVSESQWIWLFPGPGGRLISIRLDHGLVRSSDRSPILRC